MRCFYAQDSALHDPSFRLTHGRVAANAESPRRAELLLQGLHGIGLQTQEPPACDNALLSAVHTPRFLEFLETAWDSWQALPDPGPEVVPNTHPQKADATYPQSLVARAGWHMGDASCPVGQHSWTASRRAVDCAVAAAQAALEGAPAAYALCRPPGHHSDADTAAGHCLLNPAAVAAQYLRGAVDRVAILDIDVHHGNGTQGIFYDRADVLFVSIHADPTDYYPYYLGYDHETGTGAGVGHNVNMPLPRDSGDAVWLEALEQALGRIAAYDPQMLVLSLGLDAHERDPLRGLAVTTPGFHAAGRAIAAARLPTTIVQEGGYLSDDLADNLAAFLSGFLDI